MGSKTTISWTDATWSPLRARVKDNAAEIARQKGYTSLVSIAEKMTGHIGPHCERVSRGCDNCYSERNNGRCLPANGTGLPFDRRVRDLIDPVLDDKALTQPLRWRTPKRIFVENQSDLFGEWNSEDHIVQVFGLMAKCPQHTFQVLTKRPERALAVLGNRWWRTFPDGYSFPLIPREHSPGDPHFLPNVWIGVSVEDQKTANERIPVLLQIPAAKRFVSYEPALGSVSFRWMPVWPDNPLGAALHPSGTTNHLDGFRQLDWVIVGGESGSNARPFHIEWARQVVDQCRDAGVACFVKQLGAKPVLNGIPLKLKNRKGEAIEEWSEDVRMREFPS